MLQDNSKPKKSLSINLGLTPPTPPVVPEIPIRAYVDETGFHLGSRFYGYGALTIRHERRGDLPKEIRALRDKHNFRRELKWSTLDRFSAPFAQDVVRWFFQRKWIQFSVIAVERAHVDMTLHEDRNQATQKHLTMFLAKRMGFLTDGRSNVAFHVVTDDLPWAKPADEVVQIIGNHFLKRERGKPRIHTFVARKSHEVEGIQVCDLLLGGTLAAWQGDLVSPYKKLINREIADHLGWPDTKADTMPGALKFNIWNFQDPRLARRVQTRGLRLKYTF